VLLCAACTHLPQAEPEQEPAAKAEPPSVRIEPVASAPAPAVPQAQPQPQEKAESPPPAPAAPAAPAAALPPPPPNLWTRLRAGFGVPDLEGKLVERQVQWYTSNPDYVARMVERGGLFLYHVLQEVERRKMPTEIALLPMVESAYNPQAYSRSHASGMWQFIPSTGKIYGLRQNFWYDGRRDVLAATDAALDYLQKLHGQFGDWTLALAAYNWGEGAVSRAVARNQARGLPTNYESLAMPLETRNYVPKLQAVKNILANPGRYGITIPDIPNRPYFATVSTDRHIDVQLAATLAEMEPEDFKFLNPAHNKPVIRADGTETLVLPVEKVEAFRRNLEAYDQPFVTWQAYTVKRHDRPAAIAKKHGLTLAELKEANGITGGKRIVPGQTILVPYKGGAEPYLPDLPAPKVRRVRYPKRAKCYVVSAAGVKKRVQCAPTRKKTTTVKAPAKPRATSGGTSSSVSIRALTGG
jgi:membrane-bound lytic murein transglycosylase D